jgi:hypothetical protein
LDVGSTGRFAEVLESVPIELLFMSNIVDYLCPGTVLEIVDVLVECETPWIMSSHMRDGLRSKGYESEGLHFLLMD